MGGATWKAFVFGAVVAGSDRTDRTADLRDRGATRLRGRRAGRARRRARGFSVRTRRLPGGRHPAAAAGRPRAGDPCGLRAAADRPRHRHAAQTADGTRGAAGSPARGARVPADLPADDRESDDLRDVRGHRAAIAGRGFVCAGGGTRLRTRVRQRCRKRGDRGCGRRARKGAAGRAPRGAQ